MNSGLSTVTYRCSLIAAVNNDEVLRTSLLRSPDLGDGVELILKRGFSSAGEAYNQGIRDSRAEVLIFAHQDVFLPQGWFTALEKCIKQVEAVDPNWGVLGVFGLDFFAKAQGHVYSTGLKRVLGNSFDGPVPAASVDEMVIIVNGGSGLLFDAALPGFHLYGTDICLEASRRGLACYLISNFCIHNSNGLRGLPWAFWQAYLYLRNKWYHKLPVITPCVKVDRSPVRFAFYLLHNWYVQGLRRNSPGSRVADPSALYKTLAPLLN